MLRVCLLIFTPLVLSIIVTDPPLSADEYKYSYSIDDPTTGDSKSQHEVKYGETVTGAYSVVDPDGTKRTVEYRADPKTGFKAVVKLEPAVKKNYYDTTKYRSPVIDRFTTVEDAAYYENNPVYFTPVNGVQPQNNLQHFVPYNYYNF